MKFKLVNSELQYYLLSPTNPPPEFTELHNQAYHFWLDLWRKTFEDLGALDTSHLNEDFVRQNVVSCLCNNGKVIAVFLHAFASIGTDATRTHRYMRDNFPETFFEKIKRKGMQNIMTSNYLAVHPKWRKGQDGLRIAPIMVGLSLRVRDLFGADGFIGVWRNDRKVSELSYEQGGERIIGNVMNHNVLCDLILMDSRTPYCYPSKEVQKHVDGLWTHRIDAFLSPILNKERKAI